MAVDAAVSIVGRPTHDASAQRPESLPTGPYRVERGLSSPAKTFHIFGIVDEIFGEALDGAGKIAGQVVTRGRAV